MADDDQNGVAAEDGAPAAEKKKKGGFGPILIGVALALALGGASAYAVMSGLIPLGGGAEADATAEAEMEPEETYEPPAFVSFEPLTVTLRGEAGARQLRMVFAIETSDAFAGRLEGEKPRILDALNTLLRAVDERDLAEPWALDRLRAQMLRRIRIASDPTAIRDLLITEYVIF